MNEDSFFSISFDLIPTGDALGFNLYVNSSSLKSKQKYIKIFAKDDNFLTSDLHRLKKSYPQLYVSEGEREDYLKAIVKLDSSNMTEATSIIKDSAIKYLENLFDPSKEFSNELLIETIKKSKVAVESMIDVIEDIDIDSLRGLIGNLSAHDFYTYDHSINVSMYSISLVKAIKPDASRNELLHAGLGGLLHDLGKVKIPTKILNSPGGLSDKEYLEIKKHPKFGIDLLLETNQDEIEDLDLTTIGRIIHEHHENWDGSGYPQQLKDKEIHLLARVCAIVDFFDAITTKRSYSDVMPLSKALAVMENTCNKKIDERIFKIFASQLKYKKSANAKEFIMDEAFDPTIPYHSFPVHEIEEMFNDEDFGKIKILDAKGSK